MIKIEGSLSRASCGKVSQARERPRSNPPPPTSKKLRPASHNEKAPVTTAATATRKATRPVPSLTRLSPDDRAHALRHAQPAEDSLGRHGVGGREDRPEDEGRGPRQTEEDVRSQRRPPSWRARAPRRATRLARGGRAGRAERRRRPPSSTGGRKTRKITSGESPRRATRARSRGRVLRLPARSGSGLQYAGELGEKAAAASRKMSDSI